ncbi:MAG: bifunctional adenosylcobinamide kinase/adenosylcobinamide-phosphate guanylyltransferase [Bacteroidaceae bacterium]|nr:bifunctional adenosylcobinamide kinase/adenosylcobinamide-phosphate guanylyltransferase [Bacteroidaceae bacterium]
MRRIILITGGQRSGKSTFGERLALSLSPRPIYMATAHIWDEEFRQRVDAHRARRGDEWTTIEEEKLLSRHNVAGRVVLIDCCTLWATNFVGTTDLPDVEAVLGEMKAEFDRFTSQDAVFLFVSNEIGMGGIGTNALQRRFTDLVGKLNQHIAQAADEVYLMVSGINVKVK